jgi:hypothetical protein
MERNIDREDTAPVDNDPTAKDKTNWSELAVPFNCRE